MPHDKNGNEVRVGDLVVLKGRVSSVSTGNDHCNCTVEVEDGMGGKASLSALNTKALERCSSESVQEAAERGFHGLAGKPKKKAE